MEKWRINVFAYVSVIIGIIAIFSPWVFQGGEYLPPHENERTYNLFDAITSEHPSFGMQQFQIIGAWLFIIGTIVAIISPIGGIMQIIGFSTIWLMPGIAMASHIEFSVWPGILAISSAVVCCIALIKPLGLNYSKASIDLKGRLFTCSRLPEQSSIAPAPPPSS